MINYFFDKKYEYIHIFYNAIETFTIFIVLNLIICIKLKSITRVNVSEKFAKSFRYITVITHNLSI